MLERLFDALSRLVVGHNTVDNFRDWQKAHNKANESRKEVEQIIKDAELIEKAKQNQEERKDKS